MNPGYDMAMHARRKEQAEAAIEQGLGFAHLGAKWNITSVAARDWCLKRLTEDQCEKLSENGRLAVHRTSASVADRLELIALCRRAGWTDAKVARAIGCSRSGLCDWLKRNAPDGVADALQDFRDEEAA